MLLKIPTKTLIPAALHSRTAFVISGPVMFHPVLVMTMALEAVPARGEAKRAALALRRYEGMSTMALRRPQPLEPVTQEIPRMEFWTLRRVFPAATD